MINNQGAMVDNIGGGDTNQADDGSGAKNFSRTPTSWDAQDDILLMHLKDQQKLGWKEIASHFTNRTPNACQFRWRRLKSGNLKNPPKSAAALGATGNDKFGNATKKPKKSASNTSIKTKSESYSSPGRFPSAYSPISNTTFTGYDNNVSNALAGLNALSNPTSNVSTPAPNFPANSSTNNNTSNNSPSLHSPNPNIQTTNTIGHGHFDNSPKSDTPLDPQPYHVAGTTTGGGYYAEISIDPTMNLPHNQPHPHQQSGLTPRNSTSQSGSNSSGSNNNNHQSLGVGHTGGVNIHNNSIIQISRDDRNSVSSLRDSVSSLPSNSMNIPHHQLSNSALAHLPILFGGGNSISGPSRNSSISGPPGLSHHATTLSSIRNSSIVGLLGLFSRKGSVVILHPNDKRDDDNSRKIEIKHSKSKPKPSKQSNSASNNLSIFKIPWSMEEDELLINRRNRELSFAELSILLPQRTEGEIWSRIDYLEKLRNGHRDTPSTDHRKRRQSSIGLDEDDFYDDVDDVIGGMHDIGDDDDEDDDVLVDDEVSVNISHRRKRRTSSAVNPLSIAESMKKIQ